MSDDFSNPFATVDAAAIANDPDLFPEGTFPAVIMSAEIKPTADGSKTGLNIKIHVPSHNRNLNDWTEWPTGVSKNPTPDQSLALSRVKQRLMWMGTSEADLKTWKPSDLEGREGAVKITHYYSKKHKKQQHQIAEMEFTK